MIVGKREMENITIGKWGGGCSTNGHMTVGKEGGPTRGEGRRVGRGGGGEGEFAGGERRWGEEGRDGLGRPVLFWPVG